MKNNSEAESRLFQYLMENLDGAKSASGGRQIIAICHMPGCNDSSGHFYVGPFNTNTTIFYNCYKCNNSGVLTTSALNKYGMNVDPSVIKFNTSRKNNGVYIDKFNNVVYNYYNKIFDKALSYKKLKYINDRLGTNLTVYDCEKMNIVLNIDDFLSYNRIRNVTVPEYMYDNIHNNYCGFLSRSKTSIAFRCINDKSDHKHILYVIPQQKILEDFYIIPTDLNMDKTVHLHITEGGFDLLGVYYNLNMKDMDNCLFIAGYGKGYLPILDWIVSTYGIYDMEVNFYADKDIDDSLLNNIMKFYGMYKYKVHRNIKEGFKDFGIAKENIICSTYNLN